MFKMKTGAVCLPMTSALCVLTHDAFGLSVTVQDIESVPQAHRELYEKQGDVYVLSVDDSDFKRRIGEFRENNITLAKEKAELEDKLKALDGVDPAKYKEMRAQLDELEDKTLLDEGKVEELLNTRVDRMRKDFESQTAALTQRATAAEETAARFKSQLQAVMIDSAVSNAVNEIGTVRKGAMDDVRHRARSIWNIDDDGNPVAINPDGSKRFGKDGSSPLTMQEFARELLTDAPFLFEESKGGGAGGSGDDRGGGTPTGGAVAASDRAAFSRNLEKIAKGEMRVVSS